MNRRLLRCHGFFKVSDIFSSTATLSTFGKGGAKVEQNLIHLWKRWSQSGAKPYQPLEKVEPKTTKKQRKTNKNKEKQIKHKIN